MSSITPVMDPSKLQLLSEKIVTPSSPTPPHLKHYDLSYIDQLISRRYIAITLFYPNKRNKQAPTPIKLEKSLSDLLTFYYPYAGRIVDNKAVECNDKGAIFTESRIMYAMSDLFKHSFSSVQDIIGPKDLPWSEPKLEVDSLANARLTHFECGGKAISLCLTHKLGDSNTLCNFLLHWSALTRGVYFPPPLLVGASLLPPNDDRFTATMFDVKTEPHTARRFEFDVAKIDRLMALVASQSDIKNPTRVEIVTAFMNSCLARVQSKMMKMTSTSPFTIYIPLNFRKLVSKDLTNLMGNVLSSLIIDIKDENDFKLPRLVSMIRREKISNFEKYKRLTKAEVSTVVRTETDNFPTGCADLRLSTSLCDYPLYDIDFGWGKPSRVSFGALPNRNTFIMFDSSFGGVVALAMLDEQIMEEFLKDEQIIEYASLDPSY